MTDYHDYPGHGSFAAGGPTPPATETLYRMDVYQQPRNRTAHQEDEGGYLYFSRQTRDLVQFESWREYAREFDKNFGRTTRYFIGKVEWEEDQLQLGSEHA